MAYSFYLDGVLLPIAPSKLQTKIKNQNKTINLINDGEVTRLEMLNFINTLCDWATNNNMMKK